MYKFSLDDFLGCFQPILSCIGTTMWLTFATFLISLVLAIGIALITMSKNKVIDAFFKLWISLFRGTPLICQLFLFVYGVFPNIPGIKNMSSTGHAILCLSLSFSAYMSETIRGAILSIDKGQQEACYAIGMSKMQGMRRIIIPQAIQAAVPALSNNFLDVFKGTALTSLVGIMDIMLRAKMIAQKGLRFIETYLCVLLIYWVINLAFVEIQKRIERYSRGKF